MLYKDWRGTLCDEDWTLAKIAQAVRRSSDFFDLPKKKQKEYTADAIEEFLRKNSFYKSSVYMDSHTHAFRMRDWRLKLKEQEEGFDI